MGNVNCVNSRPFNRRRGYSMSLYSPNNNAAVSDYNDANRSDLAQRGSMMKRQLSLFKRKRTDGKRIKGMSFRVGCSGVDNFAVGELAADQPNSADNSMETANRNRSRNVFDSPAMSISIPTRTPVNVNTCTVSDLMAFEGVDQSVATNIVIYREKKGPFKQLDKLLKVPGVTKQIYYRIAPYVSVITLEDDDSSGLHVSDRLASDGAGRHLLTTNLAGRSSPIDKSHSRQSSAFSSQKTSNNNELDKSMDNESGKDLGQANIELIYRLMCSKSERPKVKVEADSDCDTNRLRIGCWDLEGCSFDKAHNPGVLEVICMTCLENRWNFVIMTNFAGDHVIARIVAELNFPTLHKVRLWRQTYQSAPRFECRAFDCGRSGEYYGYIYAIPFVKLDEPETDIGHGITVFEADGQSFTCAYDVQASNDTRNLFSITSRRDNAKLAKSHMLGFGEYVFGWNDNVSRNFQYHNGSVEDGLSHLAIPCGWSLGGRATRSNPIWIYFDRAKSTNCE